jgi:hypothetical protein
MPDVRIVGDAIEVDGVVVATITETTGTSRREGAGGGDRRATGRR